MTATAQAIRPEPRTVWWWIDRYFHISRTLLAWQVVLELEAAPHAVAYPGRPVGIR